MLYCPNCQRIAQADCPNCGRKAHKLRPVQARDPVHFFTGDYIRTSMVEPLLEESGIPYSKRGARGAALATLTGSYLEQYMLFVPYAAYERAVRLVADVFGTDEGFMRSLCTLGVDLSAPASGNADADRVAAQYAAPDRHDIRRALHARFTIADIPYSDWLLNHMELRPGMRILDIGCGSGDIWAHGPLPDGLFITMADASPGMLDAARTRTEAIANVRFEFVQADACAMPFESGLFDLILASHMLFHVGDLYAAVGEIARILKPDGMLCATTMSQKNLKEMYELAGRHGIVLPHPGNSFDLESGAAALKPFFGRVRREDYKSSLQITEAEPLIQYMQSMDSFGAQCPESIESLGAEVRAKIARDGSFDVSKLSCAFLCTRKEAPGEA